MVKFTIYDYVDPIEGNLMKTWSLGLQKKELAKLNAKIDALEMYGNDLIPGILSPTGTASIFKLKIQGQVKLRPMVCEGPGNKPSFTFLIGAKEISWGYEPAGAPDIASRIRQDLLHHPERRIKHERVAP
jgi:hypothetical protein